LRNWRKVLSWEAELPSVSENELTRKEWGGFGRGRVERQNVLKVGNRYFRFLRPISYRSMQAGTLYGDGYHATNSGYDVFTFLGYSDMDEKYGEGGVKFSSIREVFQKYNVTSLSALEEKCWRLAQRKYPTDSYGHDIYMWEEFVVEEDSALEKPGGYYYISGGKWCRGSGAEPLTFWTVEEVQVNK
jgi:hypothetical protein